MSITTEFSFSFVFVTQVSFHSENKTSITTEFFTVIYCLHLFTYLFIFKMECASLLNFHCHLLLLFYQNLFIVKNETCITIEFSILIIACVIQVSFYS